MNSKIADGINKSKGKTIKKLKNNLSKQDSISKSVSKSFDQDYSDFCSDDSEGRNEVNIASKFKTSIKD